MFHSSLGLFLNIWHYKTEEKFFQATSRLIRKLFLFPYLLNRSTIKLERSSSSIKRPKELNTQTLCWMLGKLHLTIPHLWPFAKDFFLILTNLDHYQSNLSQPRTLQEDCTLQTISRLSPYDCMYVCILVVHCILFWTTRIVASHSRLSTTFALLVPPSELKEFPVLSLSKKNEYYMKLYRYG